MNFGSPYKFQSYREREWWSSTSGFESFLTSYTSLMEGLAQVQKLHLVWENTERSALL